mmetsp:Transcript_22052/g.28542  ORF Transcript_22052/g.28542 Transcript_22052/m.28542 type:complete len:326 (+) Transcript_22052:192-1169(+)|eukprot:CAMPEP_0198139196 /NCGR_PEP_ID=MMETSP1443-20131203/2551_1 /TAXON_ID=186043 /ORGANISM="Entomoneis sp., Strain CCMP2396" /LENGTH=325 /DNA_ID=CAMNT_0043801263 /DNA_START=189 /DNA_END=1166 /DNA_ORIENTATION=+
MGSLRRLSENRPLIFFLALMSFTAIYQTRPIDRTLTDNIHELAASFTIHDAGVLHNVDNCWEDEETDRLHTSGFQCRCPDPRTPAPKRNRTLFKDWSAHHRTLVQDARSAEGDVDVVFIGDSLTEKWRGSWQYGTEPSSAIGDIFDKFFKRENGAKLNGLALGSSGDISSETLWQLKHGLLSKNLNPKAFVLALGMNDLDRAQGAGCSKRNTLAGILTVVAFIRENRPDTPLIIHGLLPRADPRSWGSALGLQWKKSKWINARLKEMCNKYDNLYFFDTTQVFMAGDNHLRSDFMEDDLHLSVQGYEQLTPEIARNIESVLKVKA